MVTSLAAVDVPSSTKTFLVVGIRSASMLEGIEGGEEIVTELLSLQSLAPPCPIALTLPRYVDPGFRFEYVSPPPLSVLVLPKLPLFSLICIS